MAEVKQKVQANGLTQEQEDQLRTAFKELDEDNSGSIDYEELHKILDAVGSSTYSEEEVKALISSVDEGGDGEIQEEEFIKLISDQMKETTREEEMVELFKSFGPSGIEDVITIGALNDSLTSNGEILKDPELNMIFEELAGQTKRYSLTAEKRFDRTQGITFHDFLLLMLPK